MCLSKGCAVSGENGTLKIGGHKTKKPRCFQWGFFDDMARLEGFEPPTAWFVARYSIQLSYRR